MTDRRVFQLPIMRDGAVVGWMAFPGGATISDGPPKATLDTIVQSLSLSGTFTPTYVNEDLLRQLAETCQRENAERKRFLEKFTGLPVTIIDA